MHYRRKNCFAGIIRDFPRSGLYFIVGAVFMFFMGMRFATRREPLVDILFHLLKVLKR
ncbi:putative membrane protein [Propionispora sp. 2/2-37]|nr:putative membrane protein [Propionispora sp. 2/2-37]